jgi:predicted RNA-binding protein (virulence factor B family)
LVLLGHPLISLRMILKTQVREAFHPSSTSLLRTQASYSLLLTPSNPTEIIGSGLILQRDIHKFRESRDNVDVVVGELLDGFCQRDRREDGRVDISLFPVGINKLNSVRDMILAELDQCNGRLDIGEKVSKEE